MTLSGWARVAGAIYLVLILSGIFGLVYVPSHLIDWADAAATAAQIKENDMLFRLGVVANLICFVCFIFLPLVLYKLLAWVNRGVAILMVVLALISIPMTLVNIVKLVDVLTLLEGHSYLAVIESRQLHAQVMFLLASFNNSTLMANFFWGAWLVPFGYLVFCSGVLPKFLGACLMLGALGYWLEFVLKFVFVQESVPVWINIPSSIGEFGICLWLLIMGAKALPMRQPHKDGELLL